MARPPRKAKRSARAKQAPTAWVTHTIKKGDTLSQVAKRYRLTVDELRKINRLKKKRFLRPGQVLKIKVRKASTRRGAAAERRSTGQRHTKARRAVGPWVTHKVRKGDYLWGLADKYDVTVSEIVKRNRLGKRRRINPGQVLKIKRKGSQMLVGGLILPKQGEGYVRMRPKRSWGTAGTVTYLQEVYRDFMALHPDSTPGMIADLSKQGGGYLPPHKSHQRGVDVDVSYYKADNERSRGLEVVTPETWDVRKNWDLIRLYLNTGHVSAIFMDWHLQAALYDHLIELGYKKKLLARILQYPRPIGERRGIIRHSPGHHHHLHIRFDCTKPDKPCKRPRIAMVPPPPVRVAAAPPIAIVEAAVELPKTLTEPLVAPQVVQPAVSAAGPAHRPGPPRRPGFLAADRIGRHAEMAQRPIDVWRSALDSADPTAPILRAAPASPRRCEGADRLPRFGVSQL